MAKNQIEAELRGRVDAFVADLTDIIHRAALDSVREALGASDVAERAPRRRKATKRPARAKAGRGGRVRRSSEDLEALSTRILEQVGAEPGRRLEELGVAMGEDTKDLKRPIQLLLAEGKLRTEGQRRGTKYFPGGGKKRAAKSPRARKSTKRKKVSRRSKSAA